MRTPLPIALVLLLFSAPAALARDAPAEAAAPDAIEEAATPADAASLAPPAAEV